MQEYLWYLILFERLLFIFWIFAIAECWIQIWKVLKPQRLFYVFKGICNWNLTFAGNSIKYSCKTHLINAPVSANAEPGHSYHLLLDRIKISANIFNSKHTWGEGGIAPLTPSVFYIIMILKLQVKFQNFFWEKS